MGHKGRQTGRLAAAAAARQALQDGGGEAAGDTAKTVADVATRTGKHVTQTTKDLPWWQALGPKGVIAATGAVGVAAVGVVLVAVLVLGPGGDGGGDDVRTDDAGVSANGGKTGKTTDRDATIGSKSGGTTTTTSTTTTLPGDDPTTTGGGGSGSATPTAPGIPTTPGGGGTTPTTRGTTTSSSTTTTRLPAPVITNFTVNRTGKSCTSTTNLVEVWFSWKGSGVVTSGEIRVVGARAPLVTGITTSSGSAGSSKPFCGSTSATWRLTLTNATGSDTADDNFQR